MMPQKFIQFNGTQLSYRTTGQGKTVMLFHGFGEDSTVFNQLVKELEHQYKFIVPDIPGTGPSELIPGADIDTYAEAAKIILDAEIDTGNRQITLIGHSMGGYITLAVAEKYPDLLNGFGLLHSSAFADSAEKKTTRTKAIEFIEQKGAYSFLKTSTPGLFNEESAVDNKPYIDDLLEKSKSFTPEALIQYYRAMINRPDRTSLLKEFPNPVLFIIGKHDKAIPFQSSLEQCHLPSKSYVYILEKSGHMGIFEEPAKVLHAVTEFLDHVNKPAQ